MSAPLLALPVLQDNYIWLLQHGGQALVVDPAQAEPAVAALQAHGLALAAIVITHHHADHTAGVGELFARCGHAGTRVYLPAADAVAAAHYQQVPPQQLVHVQGGSCVQVAGLALHVLDVPGHTAGHVAYYCEADGWQAPVLFCGDVLFSAGCGRVFEGTPAQMWASLQHISHLPDETLVCCAHEYTLSNLRFALAAEPDNASAAQHLRHCEQLRAQQLPTLPSRLGLERQINPFLRTSQPAVAARVRQHAGLSAQSDEVAVFAALRQWKDNFSFAPAHV